MGGGGDRVSDFGPIDCYADDMRASHLVKEIIRGPIKLLHELIVGSYATCRSDVLDCKYGLRTSGNKSDI